MRLSVSALKSVANYSKMSETPASPTPTTPTKETEVKQAPASPNGTPAKKFEGDGMPFKGKLIGMEDLSVDRDEKLCLDSMFKLKAVVRARGEHKQKIQLNLTMTAVKVIDDITKVQIASHEIERISFVVIDPRDNRAFGYIYNTSDERHQFWAIKTERAAAATVLGLKELFELAFEQYTNSEKAKTTVAPTPAVVAPIPPPVQTPVQPTPEPLLSMNEPTNPVVPPPQQPLAAAPAVPAPVQPTKSPSDVGDLWGGSTSTAITLQAPPPDILWDFDDVPVSKPTPKVDIPIADMFNPIPFSTPSQQQPAASSGADPLFDLFPNAAPVPVPQPNPYSNMFAQPPPRPQQPPLPFFPPAPVPQQPQPQQQSPFIPPSLLPSPLLPQYQQPADQLLGSPISPVAPATVTNPFSGFDILVSGLTSGPAAKPLTKDNFYPPAPLNKSIQQLQMEKKP